MQTAEGLLANIYDNQQTHKTQDTKIGLHELNF